MLCFHAGVSVVSSNVFEIKHQQLYSCFERGKGGTTQAFKYFCRVSHLSLHVRRRLYIWVVLAGLVSSPAADGDDNDDGNDGDDVEEEADDDAEDDGDDDDKYQIK